jgi:hypothetical protein
LNPERLSYSLRRSFCRPLSEKAGAPPWRPMLPIRLWFLKELFRHGGPETKNFAVAA